VAVALISAKPAEHFRTSSGGYFHGMIAKAGGLNLVRTIWNLRQRMPSPGPFSLNIATVRE
jgi:replication initiation protein RepC